jgi:leucyl aminopeptidase
MINLDVVQGELTKSDADTLIVNLFEGVTEPGGATAAVDQALDGALRELVATGDFKGKTGEVTVLYPRGALNAQRVLVVGLGKQEAFNLESVRRAMGAAVKRARSLNAKKIATVVFGAGAGNLPEQDAAQATFEGALLALYRYQAPRQQQEEVNEVEAFSVFEMDEGSCLLSSRG